MPTKKEKLEGINRALNPNNSPSLKEQLASLWNNVKELIGGNDKPEDKPLSELIPLFKKAMESHGPKREASTGNEVGTFLTEGFEDTDPEAAAEQLRPGNLQTPQKRVGTDYGSPQESVGTEYGMKQDGKGPAAYDEQPSYSLQWQDPETREFDPEVQKAQQALQKHGTPPTDGKIDGYFGDNTKAAVIKFQEQNGLDPTGVIDEQTAKLLGIM